MEDLTQKQWFVMRDLKRVNAKLPAYKFLSNNDVTVFVPTKWNIVIKKGKREPITVPVLQDLLFVYDSRQHLDPLVAKMPTLQYQYLPGAHGSASGRYESLYAGREGFQIHAVLFTRRNYSADVW